MAEDVTSFVCSKQFHCCTYDPYWTRSWESVFAFRKQGSIVRFDNGTMSQRLEESACWNISSRWESFSRIELISVESRGIRPPRIRSCSVLENDIIGIQRTVKVAQSLTNRRMGEFPTSELTAILIGNFIRHLWNAVKWLALSDYSRNRFYRLSKCQNNVVPFLVTYFRWKWTAIWL